MKQVHSTPRAVRPERSVSELVKEVTEQASVLVRDEAKLAQVEMTQKGKQAGTGLGMIVGGGLIAAYGVGCLVACVVIAISHVLTAWLAALITGAGLLALAAIAALIGRARLRKSTPPVPQQTVSSVKTAVTEIRERARHDHKQIAS
jgi:uncharacterized membrane protein YqjE